MVHKKLFDRIDSIEIKKVSKKYRDHTHYYKLGKGVLVSGGGLEQSKRESQQ